MVGLKLLLEARVAGLKVRAEEDRLVVRGPRSAEKLAHRLLEHKAEVVAAVDRQARLHVWRRGLREVAERWNMWSGQAPMLGEERDARLTMAVKEAILAGDVAATERSVRRWLDEWARLLEIHQDRTNKTVCGDETPEKLRNAEVSSPVATSDESSAPISDELRLRLINLARLRSAEQLFALVDDEDLAAREREIYRGEIHRRADILFEEAMGRRPRPNQGVWHSLDRRKSSWADRRRAPSPTDRESSGDDETSESSGQTEVSSPSVQSPSGNDP